MTSREMLQQEFVDPEARHDYADILLSSRIALQIKVLRQQRGWNQEELAVRADLHQSQISAMEQTSHSNWSLRTLKKLARAFDLALLVRFESFGTLLEAATSMSREDLEKPSFGDDPSFTSTTVPENLPSSSGQPTVVNANIADLGYYRAQRTARLRARSTTSASDERISLSMGQPLEVERG